jgi:hypothetical protein
VRSPSLIASSWRSARRVGSVWLSVIRFGSCAAFTRPRRICRLAHPQTGVTPAELLCPRLRPPEWHASWPDTCVEDRLNHQPRCPYAPATGTGAPHATQHLPDRGVAAVERRTLGHGKGALAIARRRKAINSQIEISQLMQRTGEDGDTLSTGGGIGGGDRSIWASLGRAPPRGRLTAEAGKCPQQRPSE